MTCRTFFGKIKFNYETIAQQPKTEDSTEVRPEWPLNLAKKPADLMEALDNIFELEHVDLEGVFRMSIFCSSPKLSHSTLGKMANVSGLGRKVPRYVTIETLPPILQIFIPRVGWDNEKKQTFKLETPLQLQDRIFMDQFMDGNPELINKRRKRWKWKKELRVLEAYRARLTETSVPDAKMADVLDGMFTTSRLSIA